MSELHQQAFGKTLREADNKEKEFQIAKEEMLKKEEAFWEARLKMAKALIKLIENEKYFSFDEVNLEEERAEAFGLTFPVCVAGEASYHNEDMTKFWWVEKFRDENKRYKDMYEDPDAFVEVRTDGNDFGVFVYALKPEKYSIQDRKELVRKLACDAVAGFNDFCCMYSNDKDGFQFRLNMPHRFLYPYIDEKVIQGYVSSK